MTIPWLRLSARVAHFLGVTLPEETDFEVGVEAWGRGDYDRALQEFRLLAEQGHAQAQLNQACVGEKTILPEGLTRPKPCAEEDLPKK